jgi:hypothetical protein
MNNEPKSSSAEKPIYVCQIFIINECMELLKSNKDIPDNISINEFLAMVLQEKSFGNYFILPFDISNPKFCGVHVQKDHFPPSVGEIFILPIIDKITGNFVRGYVAPDIKELLDFIFYDNGIVLKNGEKYIPNLHEKDEYPLLEWHGGNVINLGNFLWDIFCENKLEADEEISYVNGNKMDYRITNMVKIKRDRKNSGKKPVMAINIDTDEIFEFESSAEADRRFKFGRLNIQRWADKGRFKCNYIWKRKDQIREAPNIENLIPNIPLVTLVMETSLDEIVEEIADIVEYNKVFKTIKDKIRVTRQNISRVANSKKDKFLAGYYWIHKNQGLRTFEISHIKTTRNIMNENPGTYIDLDSPIDKILQRRPRCIKLRNIILYENGKYKYPGDTFFRPRDIKEIEATREQRKERQKEEKENKEKEFNRRLRKEIKKYHLYRVTRAYNVHKIKEDYEKCINKVEQRNQKLNDEEYRKEQEEINLKISPFGDNKSYRLAYLVLKRFGIVKNVYRNSPIKYLDNNYMNCHIKNLMKTFKN